MSMYVRTHVTPGRRHAWRCVHTGRGTRRSRPAAHRPVPRQPVPAAALQRDTVAALWWAYVQARWPAGHLVQVARLLVEELRSPHAMTVDLDARAVRRLLLGVHLRPPGLRRLLARLVDCGLLVQIRPGRRDHLGGYALVLPPELDR
jgi:hypothetical protein